MEPGNPVVRTGNGLPNGRGRGPEISHPRFLGPTVYKARGRRDRVSFSRWGCDMSNEPAPPFLVDAVRASASKMQAMKAALEARARELDHLKEKLDAERRDLEALAAGLESERRSIEGEREEIRASRASVDRDVTSARDEG